MVPNRAPGTVPSLNQPWGCFQGNCRCSSMVVPPSRLRGADAWVACWCRSPSMHRVCARPRGLRGLMSAPAWACATAMFRGLRDGRGSAVGLCAGQRQGGSTRAMKASNSSDEAKWVARPDTTCSTRPARRPWATLNSGVHLHEKRVLRGQWVGRLGVGFHRHLVSCYSGLGTITGREYRFGRVGKS